MFSSEKEPLSFFRFQDFDKTYASRLIFDTQSHSAQAVLSFPLRSSAFYHVLCCDYSITRITRIVNAFFKKIQILSSVSELPERFFLYRKEARTDEKHNRMPIPDSMRVR